MNAAIFYNIWHYYQATGDIEVHADHCIRDINFVYLSSAENLSAVLPVSIESFTANAGQGIVTLKWDTASEQNNKGFRNRTKQY